MKNCTKRVKWGRFKEISAQIKTFVNMRIRDLAQGIPGKQLKWILILFTLLLTANLIYINIIAIFPGTTTTTTTIIIIIIIVYLISIIIKIIFLIAMVILSLYSQNGTFC